MSTPREDAAELPSGAPLAAYRVARTLGAGQMGIVYEAEAQDGRRVAVKVLRFAGHDRFEIQQRFAREARLSQSLQHPNIVPVIDHGLDRGKPFLVMPLLVGRDLETWLGQTGPLPPAVAVSIVLEAARGLAAAHAKNVVHRDFKPANVMLYEDAGDVLIPIVCDFGVAKTYDDDGTLTASGAILGTPLYMAPEQFVDCKRVDARCDVWALGMTLYHALAGRSAFADVKGIGDLLVAMKEERVPALQAFAPWVPPALARVVHAALLPMDRRFSSVADFVAALERWGPRPVPLVRSAMRSMTPEERRTTATPCVLVRAAHELGSPDDATLMDEGPSGAPEEDRLVGTTLGGRYQVGAKLGAGGMGAVYEAVDLAAPPDSPAKSVAIKVMLLDPGSRSGEASRRFVREARAAQKVRSPHAAAVLDVGVDASGAHYLVMERLRGKDLSEILKHASALAPEVAVTLVLQACEGLAAAHAMGIVHRDIKPSNLFVHEVEAGTLIVKVCDFGIAKQLPTEGGGVETSAELTQTGGLLGSPLYMSPEQAKSAKNVDARSDVFSLTLSLHEALSGQRPWEGRTSMGEIIVAVVTEDVPSLLTVAPWIDPRLASVVDQGLARDVTKRTPSIADLANALRPFGSNRPLWWSDLTTISNERRSVAQSTLRDGRASRSGASTGDAVSTTRPGARQSRGVLVGAVAAVAVAATVGVVGWTQRGMFMKRDAAAAAPAADMHSTSNAATAAPPPPATVTPAPSVSVAATATATATDPKPRIKPPPHKPGPSGAAPSATTTAATTATGASTLGRGVTATDLPGN
jgi:serine/threonine protein kinase